MVMGVSIRYVPHIHRAITISKDSKYRLYMMLYISQTLNHCAEMPTHQKLIVDLTELGHSLFYALYS